MDYKFCYPNASITCILRDSLVAQRSVSFLIIEDEDAYFYILQYSFIPIFSTLRIASQSLSSSRRPRERERKTER